MKNDNIKNQYRVNDQIRAREVRIVGDDIESIVMPLNKALALADEKELDLVEISPCFLTETSPGAASFSPTMSM